VIINEDEYLSHYGTPRHSGRYPWGSGDNETNTRNPSLLDSIDDMKKQGMKESEIATALGMKSTTELRKEKTIAIQEAKQEKYNTAKKLQDKGMSVNAIAKQMGEPEPTIRSYLKQSEKYETDVLTSTANMLRKEVDEKKVVDIGKGVENSLGVSQQRLSTAAQILEKEGYGIHSVNIPQVTTQHETRAKVLAVPGLTQKEIWQNQTMIQTIKSASDDFGKTYYPTYPPLSLSPKRLQVVYGPDGGAKADGVIYVRPGVKDISLGGKNYAQVRVKVGKDHFIKGMAVYKDDLPDGVDIQFHTSKKDTGNKLDTLKALYPDPELPFNSIVRQIPDIPGKKPSSVMNIVNDEGDWETWSRTLSQQFLSKQERFLAKQQLDMTYERRENDYKNILKLTNPTVREKLLMDFAGSTDSAVVHLKAAALPGQAVRVILPVPTLKSNQVYAPGFNNGETVVLIRHPHGGTFEIPQLTVNNKHSDSRKLLGDAKTAIGINHEVAQHLSGADFDGDTVLVIPNKSGRIKISAPLESLKGFDPVAAYPGYPGMKVMGNTQTAMGSISNLITDMSIKGASQDKIARAVRHSMVVIDAEKKELDYRKSYSDNNIKALKQEFQRQSDGGAGAATLLSRRKYEERVPERKPRTAAKGGPIDKATGKLMYEPTDDTYWKTGKAATSRVPRIELTDDAFTLSSGTPIEAVYAKHANKLKDLANQARLSAVNTPRLERSASARKTYDKEYQDLKAKLDLAKSNAPLERQAQIAARAQVKLKRSYNPDMDKDTIKKTKQQAITEARRRVGADKHKIEITEKEWDAIQSGAISDSMLTEILTHADMDVVRQLATPKTQILMTPTATATAKTMLAQGYTRAEVAAHLGVSVTTLDVGVEG
jgi:predicted transcriptional regulator